VDSPVVGRRIDPGSRRAVGGRDLGTEKGSLTSGAGLAASAAYCESEVIHGVVTGAED
jgi:hypothetical protein